MLRTLCLTVLLTLALTFNIHQRTGANYDLTESKTIIKLAATAFCSKQCVDSWSCRVSKELPLIMTYYLEQNITKAAGYVGYRKDTNQVVLGFRGSSNRQNWIEDVNFEKVPYLKCSGCEIHAGFYADYLSFEKVFKDKVAAILQAYPTASILTTGHSLGAALSLISAIELKAEFPSKQIYVHNFGQPRIGNSRLASYLTGKLQGIIRVVHNRDIVPHMPPEIGFGYRHPPY